MQINVLTLVGIGLAAMFFGYFFGLFEGRRNGYKKRRKEEAAEQLAQPVTPTITVPAPKTEGGSALLELALTERGRPQVHIDGREVDALRVSAAERRRLIELMVMLKPWVEPGGAAATAAPGVAAPKRAAVEQATPAPARLARSAAEAEALIAPTPAPAQSHMSLVAQIDAILQARLAGTRLAESAIRLAESLHGGAIVFVGTTQYDGVDQVTDPEIQSAIRAAIAEWETKYTPG